VNVLILDTDTCGVDMAYRAAEAGHNVRLWIPKEKGYLPDDGRGFPGIERINDWQASMPWAKSGLVIYLFNGKLCKELDRYREFGYSIFAPSAASSDLEVKRAKGMEALKKAGIEVPPYKTFGTLQEALKHAKSADDRLVFKTMGDEEDKSLSYCGSDPEDMVWRIKSWIDGGMTLKGPCMLQEFIEGIEVGVSGWMGKSGFLPDKWNINFEFKKLMSEDYGPATGEMGTVCKYCPESKLADEILAPLEKTLKELGHIGDTDLNAIIDEHGKPWPLEWTARFGWPSTQILMASHKGDPVKWMKDAIAGKDTLDVDERVAMGVMMASPPFPQPDLEHDSVGMRVTGMEECWDNVSPWQVQLKDGEYVTTGPYVCVVTALGSDVHDVIPKCYATVDRIKFPNRIVRSDIGKRLEKQLPQLHSYGYSEMPEF
jgi:phosphoribosylamine---glycine ligase